MSPGADNFDQVPELERHLPAAKTLFKAFLVPGGVLLLCAAVLQYSGWMTQSAPALVILYYCGLLGGMLLAWRFRTARIFFLLLVLFLSRLAMSPFAGTQHSHLAEAGTVYRLVSILVPINFVLLAFMRERGLTKDAWFGPGVVLFVESVVVMALWRSAETLSAVTRHTPRAENAFHDPGYILVIFGAAGLVLLVRFLSTQRAIDGALIWALGAFFLSQNTLQSGRVSLLYMTAAVCILAVSIIEKSYALAYHDELTGLPSRRAFNDALHSLQHPYSIAVVDIDHFKRFNDTHGHETGDQVLRLVATKLSRVTGGGRSYRCGGEEFMILFPGKTTPDVHDHLENLRATIESSEFRMRGVADRRRAPRGPERRNPTAQRKPRKSRDLLQKDAEAKRDLKLTVTVSIGIASSKPASTEPEMVLQSADKALYAAKGNGRNRVEIFATRGRSKSKTAGIA